MVFTWKNSIEITSCLFPLTKIKTSKHYLKAVCVLPNWFNIFVFNFDFSGLFIKFHFLISFYQPSFSWEWHFLEWVSLCAAQIKTFYHDTVCILARSTFSTYIHRQWCNFWLNNPLSILNCFFPNQPKKTRHKMKRLSRKLWLTKPLFIEEITKMTTNLRAEPKINIHTGYFQTPLLKFKQKWKREMPGSSADPEEQAHIQSSNQVVLTFNTAARNNRNYPKSTTPSAIYSPQQAAGHSITATPITKNTLMYKLNHLHLSVKGNKTLILLFLN